MEGPHVGGDEEEVVLVVLEGHVGCEEGGAFGVRGGVQDEGGTRPSFHFISLSRTRIVRFTQPAAEDGPQLTEPQINPPTLDLMHHTLDDDHKYRAYRTSDLSVLVAQHCWDTLCEGDQITSKKNKRTKTKDRRA